MGLVIKNRLLIFEKYSNLVNIRKKKRVVNPLTTQ